jgi:DNA recombination protein RmuC
MTSVLLVVAIVLLVVAIAAVWVLLRRIPADTTGPVLARIDLAARGQERLETAVREEMARNREEHHASSRGLREEVGNSVQRFGDSLVSNAAELANLQKNQLDTFSRQLVALTESNEKRLTDLRAVVDERLKQLQQENSQKLDEMRKTVDERLESTLEKRLGESFQQVSERLEAVHAGLGEMRTLAAGVGDLKRVLTNVKTRGTWGEVQLSTLLEQILSPEQYEQNVCCRLGSGERVEYAIRLPGKNGFGDETVWLPIDAKFPVEDYHRLLDAQEAADTLALEAAARQLEVRIKSEAKDIQSKYLNPPQTTDFGIMFLPTEGLYAEVLRRPGLAEWLQTECRVVVAGPTTLAAILNSLQMGFRTLAIQKRSSEVWHLLGVVKTQFATFGETLDKVQVKLHQASETVEKAAKRSRTIQRKLKDVEGLPVNIAPELLSAVGDADTDVE